MRQDRIQNKEPVGYDKTIFKVLKALSAADQEAKRAKVSAKVPEAQLAEVGVEVKMTPGKKKVKGVQSSKGGKIGKKDRELMNLTRTSEFGGKK